MKSPFHGFHHRVSSTVPRLAGIWLLGFFVLLPMAWAAGYSALYSLGGIGYLSQGWTWQHWQSLFRGNDLFDSIAFSLYIATAVTAIATLLALGIVLFVPGLPQRRIFQAVLGMQMGTPAAIVALLTFQLLSGGGLVSRLAFRASWLSTPSDFPSLVNDSWGIGIIVALTFGLLPLLLLHFSQLAVAIHAEQLGQLAESLGATRRQARLRVVFPMLLQHGRSMIVLIFLFALASYEIPLLLGRQSPQMFSVATQRRAGIFDLAVRPEAHVLASLYFGLCTCLLIAYLQGRRHA